MLSFLTKAVTDWYNTFGYFGIVLAMALESCLIPLPSEIVMPLAGVMTLSLAGAAAHFSLIGVAVAGAIGGTIGSIVAYWIGAYGGRPVIAKYGRYILISRHDFDMADRQFAKYGGAIAFFSRLLPVIRTYISLPAGITRMNFAKFVAYTFVGSLIWCFVLAFIGQQLGQTYDKTLGPIMSKFDYVIVAVIVVAVVAYVWRHIRKEREYDAMLQAQQTQNSDITEKMPRVR